MNNDAFGVVSHNILRSCNLGVGAGPSGQLSSKGNSTPFVISNNLIECAAKPPRSVPSESSVRSCCAA